MSTFVYDNQKKRYRIGDDEIARGGEGKIVDIGNNKVAKIYHPGIKVIEEGKFKSLSAIKSNAFVKPEKLLYDTNGKVVGFIMRALDKDYFPLNAAFNLNYCKRNNLDEKWKQTVANKMIDAVKYLHNNNIQIGDLSGLNTLVNKSGDVAFIDVDSYQTPGFPHTCVMFDEIRDYYNNGEVSNNADYFSLGIVIFYLFTNLHPFKGRHNVLGNAIRDRMLKKISVLKHAKDIIIPKCYNPLSNKNVEAQFSEIFDDGKRFLLNIDDSFKKKVIQKVTKVSTTYDQLRVTPMIENINIDYIVASDKICCVVHNDTVTILDLANKNYYKQFGSIKLNGGRIYPANDAVFVLKDSRLFRVDVKTMQPLEMTNIILKRPIAIQQLGTSLLVVDEDNMYNIDLETVYGQTIKTEIKPVYGPGFTKIEGLIQNVNGKNYIYYKDKTVNIVEFKNRLVDHYQISNVGMYQTLGQGGKMEIGMYNINGLTIDAIQTKYDKITHFGYKKDSPFIVIPEDDKLTFLRPTDFTPFASFDCDLVDQDTEVFITNAGIVLNTGDGVYLVNKK